MKVEFEYDKEQNVWISQWFPSKNEPRYCYVIVQDEVDGFRFFSADMKFNIRQPLAGSIRIGSYLSFDEAVALCEEATSQRSLEE